MEQQWFELKDARRKDWNKSVWIVLRAIKNKKFGGMVSSDIKLISLGREQLHFL